MDQGVYALRSLREFAAAEDYELTRMVLDSMREYHLPEGEEKRFADLRAALSRMNWEEIGRLLAGDGQKG